MTAILGGEKVGIPQPRESREGNFNADVEAQEIGEAERHREALHRALALTADQSLSIIDIFNVKFVDREGQRLPGGAMGIRVEVDGPDTKNPSERRLYITSEDRGGLDEETISELGAQAQQQPVGVRTIL